MSSNTTLRCKFINLPIVSRNLLLLVCTPLFLVVVASCTALETITEKGDCYHTFRGGDLFKITRVIDANGGVFHPQLMHIKVTNSKLCGIHRNAVPHFAENQSLNRWFTLPDDGVTNMKTSLTGRNVEIPSRIYVGDGHRGEEYWDDYPMWPLISAGWVKLESD